MPHRLPVCALRPAQAQRPLPPESPPRQALDTRATARRPPFLLAPLSRRPVLQELFLNYRSVFACLYHDPRMDRHDRSGTRHREMPLPAPLPSACHQSVRRSLAARRVAFATLFILVVAAMLWLAAFALSPGGLDAVDLVLLVLFLLTLPWIAVGFLNAVIGFCIMRFARDPTAAVFPSAAGIRRDDRYLIGRDTAMHSRRADRPVDPQSRTDVGGARRLRLRSPLPSLRPQRHERRTMCRPREGRIQHARVAMGREDPDDLSATPRQYRIQSRQYPGFLRTLGGPSRLRRHARRRQFHDRGRRSAARPHHAGGTDPRHSAGTGRGPALGKRVRPHLPVRHAARHALLYDRQRLVAGRLRPLLGAQCGAAPQTVHRSLSPSPHSRSRRSSAPRSQS